MAPGSPFSCTYSAQHASEIYIKNSVSVCNVLSNSNTAIDYQVSNCFESTVIYWVNFQVGMGVLGFVVIAFGAAIIFTYWQVRAFMAGEKS